MLKTPLKDGFILLVVALLNPSKYPAFRAVKVKENKKADIHLNSIH